MILLDHGHYMLREVIANRIGPANEEERKKNPIGSMIIADFDDVSYRVKSEGDALTIFYTMPGYKEISALGLEEYLKRAYAQDNIAFSFREELVDGVSYNFSLTVDLAADCGDGGAGLAERVSCLKRNVLAAPFHWYFGQIQAGTAPAQAVRVPFRRDESIYIKKGNEDQCVVIFSVTFQEKNDWVVAEVFLRELADARRDQALQQAPAASFSRAPPGELTGVPGVEGGDSVCFVSFTLFQRHWGGDRAEACVSAVCQFRNYLHYHIKASKTFMHMRMRKRVDDLLHVLNRAKPPAEGAVEKKTWSGKSVSAR
uniref:Arp2/3 complex 34 kDa subunit n=1 Tax=Hemiselmis tepida TaxID=464990 RepID=A0A7S0YKZ8_9CRYP|mmetsp:Transcript_15899/g.40305  ORF Transcript_15899/g.40305 Transcript_15899/m.40305 type:complete len:313 (+) Transcript_15899:133-1071(+)